MSEKLLKFIYINFLPPQLLLLALQLFGYFLANPTT
jgi:hypothetical protein